MRSNRSISPIKLLVVLSSFVFAVAGLVCHRPVNAGTGSANLEAASAAIYAQNCAGCHGRDGRAQTAKGKRLGATDFTGDWNTDDARGIRIITNGRDEMPSFKKKLTAEEIRSVWGYVRSFKK